MEQIDELHEKGEGLKKRLSELEAIMQQHNLAEIKFALIRQLLSTMGENIEAYSVEQKRTAIKTFMENPISQREKARPLIPHRKNKRKHK